MPKVKLRIVRKDSQKQKPKEEEDKEEKKVRAAAGKERKPEIQKKEPDDGSKGSEEIQEEDDKGLEEDFGFDEGITSRRKAPVLESGTGEKLEGMLQGVSGSEKDGEKKEETKYSFEKPKYSFSDKESEMDEIRELRKIVLEEIPAAIERTHEAGEVHDVMMKETMLGHNELEEYAVKYVPEHKETFLRESDEIKGRKVDIRKYRNSR